MIELPKLVPVDVPAERDVAEVSDPGVAGDPIESLSTTPLLLASAPSLPAEKVTSRSLLSHMKLSVAALSEV